MTDIRYVAPRTLDEAIGAFAAAGSAARIMAGGTDLLVQMRSGLVRPGLIVDIKKIDEMTEIKETADGGFRIGAAVSGAVLAEHPRAAIVMDIKSSGGLLELLDQWGARSCLSPSGHAIIKDQMRQHGALLGGELSCHFFFNDRYFGYDDGIYAMMRLIELIHVRQTTLDQLLTVFPRKWSSPEFRIACDDSKKQKVIEEVKKKFAFRTDMAMLTIDGVRAMTPYGWGIARASNTQSEICVRFESDSAVGLERIKDDFIQALQPNFDKLFLEQLFVVDHAA